MFQNDEEVDAGDIVGLKKTLMERQKVKRKLTMIKFDLENRSMLASTQQKMQATVKYDVYHWLGFALYREKTKMEQELLAAKKALEKMKSTKSGEIYWK